ncbi:MAG: hypothetical protein L3J65_09550 [Robiginitomaculum sp.]|nr:hypothetical protein [Robiginitomaculum sp.]
MREDMFKVIVERPRRGRSWATKSKLRYDKCEDRKRVSGHRLVTEHSGNVKHLNENLAPLKRYLHKQLGRRWDDVFSDICQRLDTGSTVKMHVREHLDDFILRKVRCGKDGVLMASDSGRGEQKIVDCWVELYVDPHDNVIKLTRNLCRKSGVLFARNRWKSTARKREDPNQPIVRAAALVWHVQLSSIWYAFKLSQTPKDSRGCEISKVDLFIELESNQWQNHERWRKPWKVIRKAQLSRKDLKKHGLTNLSPSAKEVQYV